MLIEHTDDVIMISMVFLILKASRIILATDADPPGQALAEELARRLGKERCLFTLPFALLCILFLIVKFYWLYRCWRVRWPKKNDTESYKDANEVCYPR